MPNHPSATLTLSVSGDHLGAFRCSWHALLARTPADAFELRLGFNQSPLCLAYALGALRGGEALRQATLRPTMERFSWQAGQDFGVLAWSSTGNIPTGELLRWLWHDVRLVSEYVVWLQEGVEVEEGWWAALESAFARKIDYLGRPDWRQYIPRQVDLLRAQPWYRGVPPEKRNGRPGVSFLSGGVLALRTACLREADFPPTAGRSSGLVSSRDLQVLLGEMARQLGWSVQHLGPGLVRSSESMAS